MDKKDVQKICSTIVFATLTIVLAIQGLPLGGVLGMLSKLLGFVTTLLMIYVAHSKD